MKCESQGKVIVVKRRFRRRLLLYGGGEERIVVEGLAVVGGLRIMMIHVLF